MGLTLETLRKTFPRSTKALDAHHKLVDQIVMSVTERQQLKLSANMIALVVGEEAIGIGKHVDLIRGLFGRGRT